MKHIAYVCADAGIPVFGTKGASIHVQSVIRALIRQGHRVTLLATRFDGPVPPGLEDVHCVQLPLIGRGEPEARARASLQANEDTRLLLDAHAPFDIVYERYSLWSDAGMRWARTQGIPGLLEVNAPLIVEQRTHRTLVLADEAERIARSAFGSASALLAVSPGVADYLGSWSGTRGRVHVIANGVDPSRFADAAAQRLVRHAQSPTRPAPCVIGFLGTLKPWHGLPVLVDAFERLHPQRPHTRLLVVGDGPCREETEAALAAKGLLAHCELTGAVQAEAVPALLTRMDIATAPYPSQQDFYFSPLKIYEYLAAELPVVTTRVGHLDEVVLADVDGLLVQPDDPQALADALMQLVDDAPRREAMGQAGRARIVAHHSWDAVVTRFLQIASECR
ncbi:MAG: glycosyltransferase family 4 protein [Lautropia sp.]|nr:glycosyltransferase family 4 protein [Lautropia sp.]